LQPSATGLELEIVTAVGQPTLFVAAGLSLEIHGIERASA